MSLRITHLGCKAALFYAILVGAFLATPYTNLFFLLLVFLGVTAGLHGVWTTAAVRGLHAELIDPGPFPAGRPRALSIVVTGLGRRRLRGAEVVLQIDDGTRAGHVVRAAWWPLVAGDGESPGEIAPLPRGVHGVRRAWLQTDHPFGMLLARVPVTVTGELVVHPEPAEPTELRGVAGDGLAALFGSSAGSTGTAADALREYRPGDDPRRVHWRASARRGELIVREPAPLTGDGAEIVFDRRCSGPVFERSLSILAAAARTAADEKRTLSLLTQDLAATFGSGHRPLCELLRWLAAAEPLPVAAPPPPPAATGTARLPAAAGRATEAV